MKVLVVIASFGTKNDVYLRRVLREYRQMPYFLDLVVLSNVPRDLGADVKVRVGFPGKDPHSLPFVHKEIFAEHATNYDLFIYSEDDILITQKNIEAFLRITPALDENEIAGFVHFEQAPTGEIYYDPPHVHYHWDPSSVRIRGDYTLAYYTNEHSACFLLTRSQLKRAINSGGFVVPPHVGRYNLACTAATDPYTQCGFLKLVCISHLEEFRVQHLPANKWKNRPYRHSSVFHRQVKALLELEESGRPKGLLLPVETKLPMSIWSKDYYETEQIASFVPPQVETVLSVGCGWGVAEESLKDAGKRVVALPLDSIVGACAEARGIEMVWGDLNLARRQLANEQFDCVLLSNVLHLVPHPQETLQSFIQLVRSQGIVVLSVPNLSNYEIIYRRMLGHPKFEKLGNYEKAGLHVTSYKVVKQWLRSSLATPERIVAVVPEQMHRLSRLSFGWADRWLGSELIAVGRKA